jgi:hypothetical protein
MIVLAYAAGAVLAIAAVVRDPGSLGTVFPLVVTAATVATVAVIFSVWRRTSLRRALAEVRSAESVVATGLIDAPRTDVAELIGQLRQLGFDMVGATDTVIGGGQPIRTWVLVEKEGLGTTWVEIGIARTPMAIFLSRGGDGRFLETSYPDGEAIDHPDLLARPIGPSVGDALNGHRAALREWSALSGPPLEVRTLEDYRRVETELRDRTGGMRIAAYLERVLEPGLRRWAVSAAIGLVAFFAVVLLPGP